ncbi:flagella basal body P-ring formation protein FlgA [Solidesulfovibrio carbinoliphilus subsp. oakridgensis]|uniref:Flagella basal body P-ring formation protein FlgA n=1 Tax=Solidesulfovibrio carbinoliphilus subsp. oakridgensis TaxID=694327 RepID=G7QCN9_9BACT|nr:flagellar basal body P-ring formation chaperone FlgA [Solidesulfovibrio carbinoliphilus]EHJ46195.1 flagella basal body P-ring formation protein FlgA [Solidesulfovibrio carbinoliphilus subsp. oakridgensis]
MKRRMLRSALAAVMCLSVFLAAWPAGAALWRLSVREAATAAGERVLLSEIASPQGEFPAEAWAALGATPLWYSPETVGKQTVIAASKVLEGLRYYLRDAPVEYVLPNQLTLMRGGRVVPGEELRAMAVETLTPKIAALGPEARLVSVSVPDHLFVDDQSTGVTVEAGEAGAGKMPFKFVVAGSGARILQQVPAEAVVEYFARVPVAIKPIMPKDGAAVEQSAYVYERRNMAGIKGRIFEPGDSQWRARRGVGAGQVIMADEMEPMPLVLRGDQVKVVYEGRSLRLTLLGEALSDGAPGGRITVKNPKSTREITGIVRDRSTVVVQ